MSHVGVESAGGPGEATVRRIEAGDGRALQSKTKSRLESALGWPHGAVDRVLAGTTTDADLTAEPLTPAGLTADVEVVALAVELYRAGLLATLDASVERRVAECLARVAERAR